jgi:superoxide reductase
MAKEKSFYRCKHCGNIAELIYDSGAALTCCGEEMSELIANTVDASKEKHVPVVTVTGDRVTVKIGAVPHPMLEEHYIMWVYLQTGKGGQRKCFKPRDTPEVTFSLVDDKPVAAYEYCNLHGLWKTDI